LIFYVFCFRSQIADINLGNRAARMKPKRN